MSPAPQITPPPNPHHRPRQDADPYGLSSLYAELSSLYPDVYSSYAYDPAYYSSLLADFSSLYPYSYSIPSFSYPGFLTETTTARSTGGRNSNPTAAPANGNTSSDGGNSGGLSSGAKIGIGVGVPVAVLLLIGIGIFLWCAGKRKGKKTGTTIVQAPPTTMQPQHVQPQYPNNQGYMSVYQPTPPPQYAQPHNGAAGATYGGYAKEPMPGVTEMEQEYHFGRGGAVEMGDGAPVQQGQK